MVPSLKQPTKVYSTYIYINVINVTDAKLKHNLTRKHLSLRNCQHEQRIYDRWIRVAI